MVLIQVISGSKQKDLLKDVGFNTSFLEARLFGFGEFDDVAVQRVLRWC